MSDHTPEFRSLMFPGAVPSSERRDESASDQGSTSSAVSHSHERPSLDGPQWEEIAGTTHTIHSHHPQVVPHAHTPFGAAAEPGYVVEGACEPEDAFYEETPALAEGPAAEPTSDHDPIAGRIGTSHGEPGPGDLVEMVLRLGQRLRGHLDGRFGAFGLSDARFAALMVIREAAPAGCTQAHLATKLGQCESSISTLVERMRASHLLYRLRAKADRRKRVLMLTDEGRALLEQGLACRDREAETLFASIDTEERRQLSHVVGRLFAVLDRTTVEHPRREADRPAA